MFAVINLGLKSIRLCLLDEQAHILFKASHPVHTVVFGLAVEQDGEEWWSLCVRLFDEARSAGFPLQKVRGLTVSASASCLACISENGALLRPVMMVSDRRHHAVSTPRISDMRQRLLWLKENEPDVYQLARHFFSPNDYLIFRLTGLAVTDSLNAMKFAAHAEEHPYAGMDPRDVRRLPEIKPVGAPVGTVNKVASSQLGISADAEVRLASYDAIVSVAGSGASESGDACDVSGTVTSVRMVSHARSSHAEGKVATQFMPCFGHNYIGGSTNLGGGLVEWLKATFYDGASHPYEQIVADAEEVAPGASRLIFLPYLLGERAPLWDPDARGVFFGLERSHGRRHFARATIEAAAFLARSIVDEIATVHGAQPGRMRLSGGLCRLGVANRIKADVLGMPVEVVAEFESTVVGAFLLAFQERLAAGQPLAELVKRSVRVRDIVLPDPEATAIYREKYAMFRDVYSALRPEFRKLQSFHLPTKLADSFLANL